MKQLKQVVTPIWFWFIPFGLIIFQIVYSLHSLNQIRFEELGDSVRMPFFLQSGYIYSGLAGNVSWYAILVFIYNLFGFSLFSAKYVRIIIQLFSLLALAAVLKKYLGPKLAIIPLLAIGLSPTLFYFNMLQNPYGMDLQFLPICLYFFSKINFQQKTLLSPYRLLFLFFLMIGWLSYPPFSFYLIGFGAVYLVQLSKHPAGRLAKMKQLIFDIFIFLLPLLLLFLFIKNRQLLIYDPENGSGLFRGGGVFKFDFALFFSNLSYLAENLFIIGNGYYYELIQVEFSQFWPIMTIILVFLFAAKILTAKKERTVTKSKLKFLIVLCLLILFLNIVSINFTDVLTPGLRRYTPVLAAFYGLYTLSWMYFNHQKFRSKALKYLIVGIFLLIPIHHLFVYPANLAYLKQPSHFAFYQDAIVFNQPDPPEIMLSKLVKRVQKEDVNLVCVDKDQKPYQCRYVEIYTAVAASCLWNHLTCHQIYGYDLKTQKFIPLSIDLWNKNIFDH